MTEDKEIDEIYERFIEARKKRMAPDYDFERIYKQYKAGEIDLASLDPVTVLSINKRLDEEIDKMASVISGLEQLLRGDTYVQVLRLVNAERAKVGAGPLQLNDELMAVCSVRSEEIMRRFAHERPDGSCCFTLLRDQNRWLGENIAAGSSTPEAVVEQWMHSDGDRTNILNEKYKELGVGYYYKAGSAYGHYWVQVFRG